ncbi:MAG: 3-oxoadipate enol-lactonase / 4-carboxymuconolactone decarboxylase, partial [Mycobacterium sp.]|nr:3-oxoadipate enol-lactonase / 4-carboxymuconolactone decarboxylase [Mycobacterium sp.]
MSIPGLIATDFGGPANGRLLLLGPSLGTSVTTVWGNAAARLCEHVRVVGWDLPGHGRSDRGESFTIAELAAGVQTLADEFAAHTFHYAGDSVGGCVGLQLLLDAPQRVASATVLCTGATIGTPDSWRERAVAVRSVGIDAVLPGAPQRWFSAGFTQRR